MSLWCSLIAYLCCRKVFKPAFWTRDFLLPCVLCLSACTLLLVSLLVCCSEEHCTSFGKQGCCSGSLQPSLGTDDVYYWITLPCLGARFFKSRMFGISNTGPSACRYECRGCTPTVLGRISPCYFTYVVYKFLNKQTDRTPVGQLDSSLSQGMIIIPICFTQHFCTAGIWFNLMIKCILFFFLPGIFTVKISTTWIIFIVIDHGIIRHRVNVEGGGSGAQLAALCSLTFSFQY